jgi:hypothetical protein
MSNAYAERVIERAERDDTFRQQLMEDPRAAISADLGIELPEDLEIRVIEEDPREAVIVLPASAEPSEVSEEQLSQVVGGAGTAALGSWGFLLHSYGLATP